MTNKRKAPATKLEANQIEQDNNSTDEVIQQTENAIDSVDTELDSFSAKLVETDKTDETYQLSNSDFLSAIFGSLEHDLCPLIVSFNGNPNNTPKSSWWAKPWMPGKTKLSAEANNYFTLAIFRANEEGQYRRQKKHFSALFAVMLDDIGTKVPHERMTLPPSWFLETSEGNYQAGYILDAPITDAMAADKLMKAIINAGLCDPGAGGPTSRMARLPEAINGKHDPSFKCKMETWEPEQRYSVDEIINALELELHEPSAKKSKPQQPVKSLVDVELYTPAPTDNPVLAAIKQKGLYKSQLEPGKHDITCPWVSEHTDQVDGGTVYYEPNDTFRVGGFKCLHGHCEGRKIRDLLDYLEVTAKAASMKPTIIMLAGEIHKTIQYAEKELANSKKYYQRGGQIVQIITDPGTKETLITPVSQPSLIPALSKIANFERFDGRNGEIVRIDPPDRLGSIICNANSYQYLKPLNGIARQPYLRDDESLVDSDGYDSDAYMYSVFESTKYSIPTAPTLEDAKQALTLIRGLLPEFCFAKPSDEAAALSAILTATIRPSLPTAPMYHARAPQISSGKTYLCQIITGFATAKRGAAVSFPQDDEECRKLLLAEFMRSPAVIEFDNITSDIVAHKSLCSALTSEHLSGRILGVSKTTTVSTRTLILSSGNNVSPIQDMVRRCITINLDPACENPASREFKNPNVLEKLLENREKYVSAVLTIILAWLHAGKPQSTCKSIATYNRWSDLCRQPLLWLGLEDPIESLFESMNDDPEREMLGRLLEGWHFNFQDEPTMVKQALNHSSYGYEDFKDAMYDIAGERDDINRKRLGHFIKRNAGRIVDGKKFMRVGGNRSAAAWKTVLV